MRPFLLCALEAFWLAVPAVAWGMYLMESYGRHWLIYFSHPLHAPSSVGNVELTEPLVAECSTESKMNGGTVMRQLEAKDKEWSDLRPSAASEGWRVAMKRRRAAICKPPVKTATVSRKTVCTRGLAGERQETGGSIQLLFDSFSQPRLAGTRSAAMRIRQMLYRVEPYQIDLHIELKPEQNRLIVTGQLVDLTDPEMVGRDVQVMLSDGREYIVNTVTNQFGEFLGEVNNSGDLEISFLGRSPIPIVILIRGPLDHHLERKDE
jgi:hypothetical protein